MRWEMRACWAGGARTLRRWGRRPRRRGWPGGPRESVLGVYCLCEFGCAAGDGRGQLRQGAAV